MKGGTIHPDEFDEIPQGPPRAAVPLPAKPPQRAVHQRAGQPLFFATTTAAGAIKTTPTTPTATPTTTATMPTKKLATVIEEHIEVDRGAASKVTSDTITRLNTTIEIFVKTFNKFKQHGQGWYDSMGKTVGGSEMAAIMGKNPYTDFFDVVEAKARRLDGDFSWDGGDACRWGTLLEDVLGACVACDLGCKIMGDDMCILEQPGHRYSPDGYAVVRFYRGDDGAYHIWTTDMPTDISVIAMVVLLEFKCPMSRLPKGTIPVYYKEQVLSGLSVSPMAWCGVYAEAVFRKCPLGFMDLTPEYDEEVHATDVKRGVGIRYPFARGLIFVYAPNLSAPLHVRLGWRGQEWAAGDPVGEADAAVAAVAMHAQHFGGRGFLDEPADVGEMPPTAFSRVLEMIDSKKFPVVRGAPSFADGRGAKFNPRKDIAAAAADAPPDHWLFAVIPWKLFSIDYHCVKRVPGYAEKVAPLIAEVHRTVAELRASPNRAAYLATARAARDGRSRTELQPGTEPLNADELQDLFNMCTIDGTENSVADTY